MTNPTDKFDEEDHYPGDGKWQSTGPTIPDEPAGQTAAEEESTAPDAEAPIFRPPQKLVKFIENRKAAGEPIDGPVLLSFIRENGETISEFLRHHNDLLQSIDGDKLVVTDRDSEWITTLLNALVHNDLSIAPSRATEREGSDWTQGIGSVNGQDLIRIGSPNQTMDKSKKASKEAMLAYLNQKSGLGGTFETFLPGAGIWARLRAPTLQEIVALQEDMQAVKLRVGAETKALAYSNANMVMNNAVTALALNCVIASNRKFSTPSDIEHELSVYDEVLLHHALGATMYPGGFNYSSPCIADPDNCNAVEKFKMNMANIVWYDNSQFNLEQRKFVAKRFSQSSDEEFDAYRKGFNFNTSRVQWFGDIGVKLSVPSVERRRVVGDKWLETLKEMSHGIYNEPPHGQSRSRYIDKLNQSARAMEHAPWVVAIYDRSAFGDDTPFELEEAFLTDDESIIEEYIQNVLSDDQYFQQFYDAVLEYANETVIGLVAIPSHNCKSCNKPQGKAFHERFAHLVMLDVLTVIFTLAGRKVAHLGL